MSANTSDNRTCMHGHESRGESLAWIVLFIVLVALLQFYLPYPVDDDTAYHYSVARLIAEKGVLHGFPWTRFSWQIDHYADKEFLFHLLFIPFTPLGFNNASRMVGILCGSGFLITLYGILRSERVRYAGLWTLVPLTASVFVYRFAQVRPQLLSMSLAMLFLWACARRKHRLLAFVSLLYPLSYVAFWQIPLLLIIAVEGARLLSGERPGWKPVAVAAAGILAGVALHPNSWNLVEMNRIHMEDVLFRNAWGGRVEFNMGDEFDPFSIAEWVRFLLVPATMIFFSLIASWRSRRESSVPLGVAVATLLFLCLTMRSNRFLEYFVPFASFVCALNADRFKVRHLNLFIFGALLIFTFAVGTTPYENLRSMQSRNWYMSPEVRKQLERALPEGANVFTTGWEYTGSLLLNLPNRNYMVALDPTLMYRRDPALYMDWYRLLLDSPENSATIIRTRFDSRYALCRNHPELWPFFDRMAATPGVRTVYADDSWILFDLGDPKR